jgi:hypothetical protein
MTMTTNTKNPILTYAKVIPLREQASPQHPKKLEALVWLRKHSDHVVMPEAHALHRQWLEPSRDPACGITLIAHWPPDGCPFPYQPEETTRSAPSLGPPGHSLRLDSSRTTDDGPGPGEIAHAWLEAQRFPPSDYPET